MKDFLRRGLLNAISLLAVSSFYPGLIIPVRLLDLIWSGLIFTLINKLVKPIIKLFLLPINLLTLGLFRWISNVLILLVLTKVVDNIQVIGFTSNRISQSGFSIPSLTLGSGLSLIIASFLLSITFNFLDSILVEE